MLLAFLGQSMAFAQANCEMSPSNQPSGIEVNVVANEHAHHQMVETAASDPVSSQQQLDDCCSADKACFMSACLALGIVDEQLTNEAMIKPEPLIIFEHQSIISATSRSLYRPPILA
jgi:hypothetical protein